MKPGEIKVGEKNPSGGDADLVETIYVQRMDFCIYGVRLGKTKGFSLSCCHNIADATKVSGHINRFNQLTAQTFKCVPKNERGAIYMQLAAALGGALSHHAAPPGISIFDEAELHIKHHAQERARFFYVAGGASCAALIFLWALVERRYHFILTGYAYPSLKFFCLGMLGALCLSFIPVANPIVNFYVTRRYLIFNGIIRVLLGGVFGFAAMLLIDGGVFLTFTKNVPTLNMFVVFAAGFSEWLIPKAIGKVSAKTEQP